MNSEARQELIATLIGIRDALCRVLETGDYSPEELVAEDIEDDLEMALHYLRLVLSTLMMKG